ncbi:MAG: 16S rRNA (guanine(966)-N(2))-methyltransferase RsmD [Pseudomonadota bacterium]
MRIISGRFSGRRLNAPKGTNTRPTTDRTREALFSILHSRGDVEFQGARVLDLFAGSGALGLEALSRGADWCLFVETDAAARGAIRENVESLGLFGCTRIHRRSATSLGEKPAGVGPKFSIAFLDPPYRRDLVGPCLLTLHEGDWLVNGAIVIIEQGKDEVPAQICPFEELDRRSFGDSQIGIYRVDPS